MNIPRDKRKDTVNLLKYCTETLKNKDKFLHNILILFLSDPPHHEILNEYLI
jgi:hypothetical protein